MRLGHHASPYGECRIAFLREGERLAMNFSHKGAVYSSVTLGFEASGSLTSYASAH